MKNVTAAESTADLTGRRWTFGPAMLDERSLEIEVAGQPVKLERKPLEVLLYLLHHAGEVVTKDDLAEALWPGRILTETVLTRCISLLRTALQDEAKTLIRTVHGFGYRLVADVRVEVSAASGPPALDFRPGDHPPQRPQWKLEERLGTGGHGEAWLARHEKTGDARVFKFAVDAHALSSLKREITLYRLMHDSLGQRAAVARIFEWNLTEPPYFIEMEHVAGGNLQTWSEAQGGMSGLPLPARLELVARIADAVAAAHSVGALHKDLKPGNVLVHVENGAPTIRLCDFGSGGVLDPQRLDALGITRQGFTKTLTDAVTSATPLYIAPEVVAGQPFTIQADIYALGILLYQVVAGDLRKALAPGWESDVADELLREDIALAAAGNPAKRLTDAAQLAERLRSLEVRRETREAAVAAQRRAELAHRALQELRRVRVYALLLLALTAVAVAGGILAHRARNEAVAATATAEAVSGFLMEDVLRVDRTVERPEGSTFEAVLNRAASAVEGRFGNQPEAAATIHWLLGRRYQELQDIEKATTQYELAASLFDKLHGPTASQTMLAKERLASIYIDHGRPQEAREIAEELRTYWLRADEAQLTTLLWRTRIARMLMFVGDRREAEQDVRDVLATISGQSVSTDDTKDLYKQWIGAAPAEQGDMPKFLVAYANDVLSALLGQMGDRYEEAEEKARTSLAIYEVSGEPARELIEFMRLRLGVILYYRAKYDEAQAHFEKARDFYDTWLPAVHAHRGYPRFWLGLIQLERRRPKDALALFEAARSYCPPTCPARALSSYSRGLGLAHRELGRWHEAIEAFSRARALATQEKIGFRHVFAEAPTIDLADSLRAVGRQAEAETVLNEVNLDVLDALPNHQVRADYLRVKGKLSLSKGEFAEGAASLREAARILELRLGSGHWRTQRVRSEMRAAQLANAQPESGP